MRLLSVFTRDELNRRAKHLCPKSSQKENSSIKTANICQLDWTSKHRFRPWFLIEFNIILIRSLRLPFLSNFLGKVALSWKVVVCCFLESPTTWASSSCFAKIWHRSSKLSRSSATLAKSPFVSFNFVLNWRISSSTFSCSFSGCLISMEK